MKKIVKSIVIVVVLTVLGVTSIFASTHFNVIKEFFARNTSTIQNNIRTPHESISDGHFKLTLEEILTDNHYVFMMYSVEGLTDSAVSELMRSNDLIYDNDFKYKILITPNTGISAGASKVYQEHSRELTEKRTATTRYWVYYNEIKNENNEPLTLRLDTMNDEQYIQIPINCNVETKELTLTGQSYGDVLVYLSPIGITIEKELNPAFKETIAFTDVFFRMQNNDIKTYNQLTSTFRGSMAVFDEKKSEDIYSYKYNARFLDAIPLSDFKSIIVGNMEYDIDNPSKMKPIALDTNMYPVEVQALLLENQATWLSAQDVCNKIGADMVWNDDKLTIKYRGSTVEITDESNTYFRDGKITAYQMPQPNILCVYEDNLYINWVSLCDSLNVNAQESTRPKTEEVLSVDGEWVSTTCTPQYTKWYIIA